MRILFLGTSDYGAPALRELVRRCHDVRGVVTQPDRKCGRGLAAAPCAIKQVALELGLPVFQPEDVNAAPSVAELTKLAPEILVVISYGQILSSEVLAIPSVMPVNIHGSLLPAYRGPAPVNWALINGDTMTGNTLMRVVRKMDAGPVILKREEKILDTDDALTLEKRLSEGAAGLLSEGLELIAAGKAPLDEQDSARATYAPKLKKTDGRIDWTQNSCQVRNRIRGLAGWPGSYSFLHSAMIKIISPVSTRTDGTEGAPGTITAVSKKAITVACGAGFLDIENLQPAGKRVMSAAEFIAGHTVKAGDRFTA